MTNPHDMIVKAVFGRPGNAAQYFKAVLPPSLVDLLDLDRSRAVPAHFVDNELRHRQADLLYEVPMAGTHDRTPPTPALVYVLFEHQSTVDTLMAFRLLRYMVRVWDHWLAKNPRATRLPMALPLVLYHGPRPWTAARRFRQLLVAPEGLDSRVLEYCPDFRFLLEQLGATKDENIPGTGIVRLTLLIMKHIRDPELGRHLWRWLEDIRQVAQKHGGLQDLELVVEYVLKAADHVETEQLAAVLGQADESAREVPMSVAERLREEGRTKGRVEGERESKARIARTLLEKGMSIADIAGIVEMDESALRELLQDTPQKPT